MTQRRRSRAWVAFWAIQAAYLTLALPLLGPEASVVLTVFLTGLTGGVLTTLLREKRR